MIPFDRGDTVLIKATGEVAEVKAKRTSDGMVLVFIGGGLKQFHRSQLQFAHCECGTDISVGEERCNLCAEERAFLQAEERNARQ